MAAAATASRCSVASDRTASESTTMPVHTQVIAIYRSVSALLENVKTNSFKLTSIRIDRILTDCGIVQVTDY